MNDEVEVTLPVSGKVAVIRSYITNSDDEAAEAVLYRGVKANQTDKGKSIEFPIENIMASTKVYVRRLVKSVDGNGTNIPQVLGELRTLDYKAIEDAVDKIVEENSPKVQKAA